MAKMKFQCVFYRIRNMNGSKIYQFNCLRCAHVWWPRSYNLPRRCPACNSPYWDRPRRERKIKVRRPPGRPLRIPQLLELAVGQELLIYWPLGPDGMPHSRTLAQIRDIIARYARQSGRRFMRLGTTHGLLVRRVK